MKLPISRCQPPCNFPFPPIDINLQQRQQGFNCWRGWIATEGINGAHPLNGTGLVEQLQQQGNGTGVAMFTEHPQALQTLIMTLLQPEQALITGPGHQLRIDFRFVRLNRIQGVEIFLRSQFLSQQLRVQGQA